MTKKSKIEVTQPVIDDQPIAQPAVVEEPASTVLDAKVIVPKLEKKAQPPASFELSDEIHDEGPADDLWAMPISYPHADAGMREHHHSPNHVPIVEVAGKVIEVKEIAKKDIPIPILSKMALPQDIGRYQGRTTRHSTGHWRVSELQRLYKGSKGQELKYYVAEVDGVKIYLTSGSTLQVINSLFSARHSYEGPAMSIQEGCTLILVASRIAADDVTLEGTVILRNSSVETKSSVIIADSMIRQSRINSKNYVSVSHSVINNSRLSTETSVSLIKSTVSHLNMSGLGSITLDCIEGSGEFEFCAYGERNLAFYASNTYLNEFSYVFYPHPDNKVLADYKPLARLQPWVAEETINITRRVDYGFFSASSSIPFIRINSHDILVGGKIFSVQEFFPEFVTKKEPAPRESAHYSHASQWPAPVMAFSSGPGYYNRESEIWQRAASIAFGNQDKPVIGKLGESIVNGLLDQIRSRINVYVEISTLN